MWTLWKRTPPLLVRRLRPSWLTRWNPISTKNKQKVSRAWWHMSIIPTTWETGTGKSLEPGRQRLQWAQIKPLHSRLGNRARLHLNVPHPPRHTQKQNLNRSKTQLKRYDGMTPRGYWMPLLQSFSIQKTSDQIIYICTLRQGVLY